jgi:hypothetical protein
MKKSEKKEKKDIFGINLLSPEIIEKINQVKDLEKKYSELKNLIIIAIEIEENEEKKETLILSKNQLNISRLALLSAIL